VLDGATTLTDVFKFIKDRKILGRIDSVRIHVDAAAQPPWTEQFSRPKPAAAPSA
jgi:hypothetical protein